MDQVLLTKQQGVARESRLRPVVGSERKAKHFDLAERVQEFARAVDESGVVVGDFGEDPRMLVLRDAEETAQKIDLFRRRGARQIGNGPHVIRKALLRPDPA